MDRYEQRGGQPGPGARMVMAAPVVAAVWQALDALPARRLTAGTVTTVERAIRAGGGLLVASASAPPRASGGHDPCGAADGVAARPTSPLIEIGTAPDRLVLAWAPEASAALCARKRAGEDGFDVRVGADPGHVRAALDAAAGALGAVDTSNAAALAEAMERAVCPRPADGLLGLVLQQFDERDQARAAGQRLLVEQAERSGLSVAATLHDTVVQELTAALLFMDGEEPRAADPGAERGLAALRQAAASCRTLLRRLRPEILDAVELAPAVHRLAGPQATVEVAVRPGLAHRGKRTLLTAHRILEGLARRAAPQGGLTLVRVVEGAGHLELAAAPCADHDPEWLAATTERVRLAGGWSRIDRERGTLEVGLPVEGA